MHYSYKTKGVCSTRIDLELDGNIVKKVVFTGGCGGNLTGISTLAVGMTVEEIQQKLGGVICGYKNTSCPDQLSQAVTEAYGLSHLSDSSAISDSASNSDSADHSDSASISDQEVPRS